MIGVAKALDSIFKEIDEDLQDEDPPRHLKDIGLRAQGNGPRDGRLPGNEPRDGRLPAIEF